MSSLSDLIVLVNPGVSEQGIQSIMAMYQTEQFEADVAFTKPNVNSDEYVERGYTRLDTMEIIPPNTEVGRFSISVSRAGRPLMEVDYDVTGRRSDKGRTMRVNLFNKLAGWRWVAPNPPPLVARSKQRNTTREGEVLISVDDGRTHYYTLEFNTGRLDGILYTKARPGEPRNRPSVKGRLILGPIIGRIQTLSSKKFHFVYEYITVIATNKDGLDPIRRDE